ncbi:putative myosin heavy chain [Besnoitia besnoiti]|uniref:Putative myosin heavy chain n=1 Tax=Besnoitia besnoiti TaxID=94643 RepID=A0A2A9MBC1_BESBE|nr:putative myosin heavy chain [Besnoitia besnoiti]PFH35275.1 putative myosin heavy chain [Besnoitia besnoiti]
MLRNGSATDLPPLFTGCRYASPSRSGASPASPAVPLETPAALFDLQQKQRDQLWRVQRLCDERLQGLADKIAVVCEDIVGDGALNSLQATGGYGKLAHQRLKDLIEEAVVRYKEKEINSYIRRVATLEASEERLRRELEEKHLQVNKSIERIVGSNNVGLRTIMQEVHDLQATCSDQAAEIARLTKDATHYKKRYEQAMEESSNFHEELLKASEKEGTLEKKTRELESQVSQLKCDLTEAKASLDECEKRKQAMDLRSQHLEQRLEDYIDQEAKKHQEVVQFMDRKMRTATLRISQYRDQRQRLLNELRRGRQRTEELSRHLQEKTREVDALKCQFDVKECEFQQFRSVAEHEKSHLDVHVQQLTQDVHAALTDCAMKTTELEDTRKAVDALKTQLAQQTQTLECMRAEAECRDAELARMREAVETHKSQFDGVMQERAQETEASRAAIEMKDNEILQLKKLLEQQKTDADQELGKQTEQVESLRHASDMKERENAHLRKLLEQHKRDFEAETKQKEHELELKHQELQRAREAAEKKQMQLDNAIAECEERGHVCAELRTQAAQLKRRCEEALASHRVQVEHMHEDFHRELAAKLREKDEEKELEIKRKLDESREEIRRSEAEATELQRRKTAADIQRMQSMIVTLTNQNKGLVKQCKLLAVKLEESTSNIEKLKDALQVEKCKLLECSEKARDAGLLRQRVAALERSAASQREQSQTLVAERNALQEDRDRLSCEAQELQRKCAKLLETCEAFETRVAALEKELAAGTQQLRERSSDLNFLHEELGSKAEEAAIYKENLKVIWSCVVEHLPVNERDQSEICVSQRLSATAVRRVHALLEDAVEEVCSRAAAKISKQRLSAAEQETLAEQRARASLEDRLRAKDKDAADLGIALAVANEKLLGCEQELRMRSASRNQMQEKLATLEQTLEEMAKEKSVLGKRAACLEQELAETSETKSEIQTRLGVRERDLVSLCKEKVQIEGRLKNYEREMNALSSENARLEARLAANQQALLEEKQKQEEMQMIAIQLEKKCLNTQKECEVLLEANKTNSENLMKQAAHGFQKELQALQLRHQEELETREAETRRVLNSRIDQMAAEAARKEEELMAEAEARRREHHTEMQLLRSKIARDQEKQAEAHEAIAQLNHELNLVTNRCTWRSLNEELDPTSDAVRMVACRRQPYINSWVLNASLRTQRSPRLPESALHSGCEALGSIGDSAADRSRSPLHCLSSPSALRSPRLRAQANSPEPGAIGGDRTGARSPMCRLGKT